MAKKSSIEAGRGHVTLGVDDGPLVQGLRRAQSTVQGFGARLTGIGATISAAGAAFAAPLAAGIRSFATYEQALADLRAVANPTAEQFGLIRDKIEEIALATGVAPEEVATAFTELFRAGNSLDRILGGLAETAIQFARVGGLQMGQAVLVLSDAMNVFAGEGMSAARAADILNSAADSATTNIAQVSEAFSTGATPMAQFNQTMLDTATAIGIMANMGLKGATAGTALKTLMLRLATGVGEAGEGGGANEVSEAMQKMGLVTRDAHNRMLPLPVILDNIRESLRQFSPDEQDQLLKGLAGTRGILGLLPLVRAGSQGFRDFQDKMEGALTTDQKFAIMLDTLQGLFKRLTVSVSILSSSIGEHLAPLLREIGAEVLPLISGVRQWIKSNGDLVRSFAVAVAKVVVIGAAITGLGGIFYALGSVFGFVASIFSVVFSPIGIGIAALAIIIGVVVSLLGKFIPTGKEIWQHWGDIFPSMPRWFSKMADGFDRAVTTMKESWGGIKDAIAAGNLELAAKIAFIGVEVAWLELMSGIRIPWDATVQFLSEAFIKSIAGLKLAWAGLAMHLKIIWSGAVNGLALVIDEFITKVKVGWTAAVMFFKLGWERMVFTAHVAMIRIAGFANPLQNTDRLIEEAAETSRNRTAEISANEGQRIDRIQNEFRERADILAGNFRQDRRDAEAEFKQQQADISRRAEEDLANTRFVGPEVEARDRLREARIELHANIKEAESQAIAAWFAREVEKVNRQMRDEAGRQQQQGQEDEARGGAGHKAAAVGTFDSAAIGFLTRANDQPVVAAVNNVADQFEQLLRINRNMDRLNEGILNRLLGMEGLVVT